MYVYVCMFICVYVYIYVCVYMCVHVFIYVVIHTHLHIYSPAHICIRLLILYRQCHYLTIFDEWDQRQYPTARVALPILDHYECGCRDYVFSFLLFVAG